ncbi:MAG TPA: IclR family transcriptional regulator [Pseudonocardia sp.]
MASHDGQAVADTQDGVGGSLDARQGIQSVEIAMTVLRALEEGRGPMSLTQLAVASKMGASKVHRYLVSLGRIGLVAQSQRSGLYDLGPAMRRLGVEALRRTDEVGVASEHLPGLRDRTGHAVNLAAWSDHGPVIVRWDYGYHALPITVRVGATMPMVSSAIGRVYLAHLPATLVEPVLRGELESGARDEVPRAEITRIQEAVRRDGFAIIRGGVVPGVVSVAAPVFSAGDSLPLAVAVAMPARVVTAAVLDDVTPKLLHATQEMSAELGYEPRGA